MSFTLRLVALFLVAAPLITAPQRVPAAQIEEVPDREHCAIRLEGEIKPGDADRFAEVLRKFTITAGEEAEGIPSDRALCLDSPGGSYLEGRKIAQLVHERGLTTRVEAAKECYSACALIFMAGRTLGGESDTVSRYLHVDGKLGFHAPYFDLAKDETITTEEAGNLVRLSSVIISEFISFSSSRTLFDIKPMVSNSLLAEMLATGPDQMAIVDTVEEAARWNIPLEGIRLRMKVDKKGAVRACLNFQSWLADEPVKQETLDFYLEEKEDIVTAEYKGEHQNFRKIQTGGMEDQHCLVSLSNESVANIGLCLTDDFNGMRIGDCTRDFLYYVPWYYALDPRAPLYSLK